MEKITCSHCEKDITHSHGCMDWRFKLTEEQISPPIEEAVVDVNILPTFKKSKNYFCNVGCLFQFLQKIMMQPLQTVKW